jgi:RNAse (barnase) inhibitor barstar
MDEIVSCRQYIIDLVELVKPKKVVANYGNHELRFQSYFTKNLDTDLLELMPQTPLDLIFNDGFRRYDKASKAKIWYEPLVEVFKDVQIEYTGDWKCRVGNVIFAHPIAYKSGNLATAEKALDYFLRTELERIDSVFMSHTHQSGDVRKGNNLTIYETGAACQVEKMNYTDGKLTNPQQKGYMIVCQDKDGNNIVEQTKRIVM